MEVAGVVLSAIPICVLALEGWDATEPRLKAFWRAPIVISRYARELRAHLDNVGIITKIMLYGCIPIQEIETSFQHVLKKDWTHPDQAELAIKLRAKHGDNFDLFQTGMQDILEDLRHVMVLLGILSDDAKLSGPCLDAILRSHTQPSQNSSRLQTRLRFAFKDRALKAAFGSLGSSIETLNNRLKTNEIWQQHRKSDQQVSITAARQRRRAHFMAIAKTLEETVDSAQASRSFEFALLLDKQLGDEDSASTAMRYLAAFKNGIQWRKAIFHASDSTAAHSLFSGQHAQHLMTIQDLWPHIQGPGDHRNCLELHLDLRGQKYLTGRYRMHYDSEYPEYPSPTRPIQMMPARTLLGKKVSRPRRLKMAATIVSWMEPLYGTPLIHSDWNPDDITYINLESTSPTPADSLCFRTLFEQPATPPLPSSKPISTALLMLGIMLIELWTNKPCAALQSCTSRSSENLGRILNDMMATEGYDLPMKYSRAVSDCWRLAHTPDAFETEFRGLVESVAQTAAVF